MFDSFKAVRGHTTFGLVFAKLRWVFVSESYLGCCLGGCQRISDLKKLLKDFRPDDLTSLPSSTPRLLSN